MTSATTEAPPAGSLSADQAGILLKANYRNLATKVQQGKTLTVAELNLLQAIQGGGRPEAKNFAKSQGELAGLLGVARKTIQRALKADGHPGTRDDGRYDVAAWRAWLTVKGTVGHEDANLSQTQLKVRHLLLQNQKLEHHLAVARREFVPAADVEAWGAELGSAIRKVVCQIHLAAPSVVGLTVADAERRLKDVEAEILQELHLLGAKTKALHEPAR